MNVQEVAYQTGAHRLSLHLGDYLAGQLQILLSRLALGAVVTQRHMLADGLLHRCVREYTPEQLQQQMSYIEQNVFLFNASIRENITLDEDFTEEQLRKAIHDSALENDLLSMPNGLDTLVGEGGCNISGGQKQRVAIARALIHERSILLVDEGTSALDAQNADLVEKSLLANPNLTLILISHHLSDKRKAQFDCVYELTPTSSRA